MKKYLVLATLWITAFSPVVAQGYLKGSHILDHWFVGAQVGFNSKLTHNPFMTHLNPHTSVRVGRDLFPAFSLIAEATSFHNDQLFADSPTPFIKAFNFDILGQVNLNNLIWGYTGRQRFCEVRFLLGWGVNHINGIEGNRNDFISKIAFDVAFRLDRDEAWEAFVEPALNYNLNRYSSSVQYNPHYAAWQLAVGAHYYFCNYNGTRRFRQSVDEVYNIEPKAVVIAAPKPVVVDTIKPVVEEIPVVAVVDTPKPVVVDTPKPKPAATPTPAPARAKVKTEAPAAGERSSEGLPVITFAASSNAIPSNQSDQLAQVAVYLRNHPRAKLVIHGTQERAKAVSDMLVRRYGVVSHRLSISAHANAKAVTFTE